MNMEAIKPKAHSIDTYSLAKGFYNVSNAIKYFESVKDSPAVGPRAKNALNGIIKRLNWCINDILTNLPRESADLMRAEVCTWETLSFESVQDEMILMSQQQRAQFEIVAKAFRAGDITVNMEEGV
jgi:hypothetical protein